MSLPQQYQFLLQEPGPKMLIEALKLFGTKEIFGNHHNQVILDWAKLVGIPELVKDDEQAWCGLFMAVVAIRGQKHVPMKSFDILRALKWAAFGTPVNEAMLGDVLIFKRPGGGHVGMYIGEDDAFYHVLGGNQSNMVSITRIEKKRMVAIRRPIYSIGQPENIRKIQLSAVGVVTSDEA
jgi:uncharacterized protein (TIGR02594 family)